jgi:1,4-alpha-glucan branching enzyme
LVPVDAAERGADSTGETNAAAATAARPDAPSSSLRRAFGVKVTTSGLLFVQPVGEARQVTVVGDFNDWDPAATPLQRDDRLGVWQGCVPVPAGRYRYQIVVDGHWQPDPYNEATEPDHEGRLRNVIEMDQR